MKKPNLWVSMNKVLTGTMDALRAPDGSNSSALGDKTVVEDHGVEAQELRRIAAEFVGLISAGEEGNGDTLVT